MTWNTITAFAQQYIVLLLGGFAILILLLFLFCIVLLLKIRRERKRYDFFMGVNRRPDYNLETQMKEYFTRAKEIDEKYTKLLNMVTDMDKTMKSNVRKVGLVRYNPFQEMGGNLCFSLALLDGEDNGVVLNGIHSRTGSFTYAKPIEMGVSTYLLSEEELEAIRIAQEKAYEPEHEKVVKLKFKPLFKRRYTNVEEKAKTEALGDVTEAEKAQIAAENATADQIATDGTFASLHKGTESAQNTENIKNTANTENTNQNTTETEHIEYTKEPSETTDSSITETNTTDAETTETIETIETSKTSEMAEVKQETTAETSAEIATETTKENTSAQYASTLVDVTSPETQACFATLLSRSRKTEMEQATADLPPMPQEEFTFPGILSEDLSHLPPTVNMSDIPCLDTVHPRRHRLMQQTSEMEKIEDVDTAGINFSDFSDSVDNSVDNVYKTKE